MNADPQIRDAILKTIPNLRAFAVSLSGNVDRADDLVQETLLRAFGKIDTFPRLAYKGRRAAQYVDDDDSQSFLYDEGLEFETNYNVTEEQVRNKLRRVDQVLELLNRRRAEEARRIG